jgi:alpha-N-arabinofuranosidase
MSAVSDLVNGWPGGIIQAGRHGVFVTPIYLVNTLYAEHLGTERLTTGVDVATLDAVASRSADKRRIYVKAVNSDLEYSVAARIRVRGAQISSDAIVERVTAESLAAVNGFATPDAVKITRDSIEAVPSFSLQLPAHSVAVLTLRVAR